MPLIVAAILGLGSFFGYVGIQSGAADKILTYEKQDVRHGNKPWPAPTIPDVLKCKGFEVKK